MIIYCHGVTVAGGLTLTTFKKVVRVTRNTQSCAVFRNSSVRFEWEKRLDCGIGAEETNEEKKSTKGLTRIGRELANGMEATARKRKSEATLVEKKKRNRKQRKTRKTSTQNTRKEKLERKGLGLKG